MSDAVFLVVDSCPERALDLSAFLNRRLGGLCRIAGSAARAREMAPPRAALVTSPLAGGGALALVAALARQGVVTVLLTGSYDAELPAAFAAGAADVLALPAALPELEVRLRARLGLETGLPPLVLEAGGELRAAAGRVRLTPSEAGILAALLDSEGGIVTRDQLSRRIDNCDWRYGDRRIDVHITRIRRKLETVAPDRFEVRTIRSVGYRLADSAREAARG